MNLWNGYQGKNEEILGLYLRFHFCGDLCLDLQHCLLILNFNKSVFNYRFFYFIFYDYLSIGYVIFLCLVLNGIATCTTQQYEMVVVDLAFFGSWPVWYELMEIHLHVHAYDLDSGYYFCHNLTCLLASKLSY